MISTLPYDVARCAGTTDPLCQTCRRREPGKRDWQRQIAPAMDARGCANHIPSLTMSVK